jgi:transposase-like protein
VLSKRMVSELTETRRPEYEAFRTRELSGDGVACLLREAVAEPWRRWGSKTGVFCVWAIWAEGGKGLLTLSTATSESAESCLDVWRDLLTRGFPTPVTITTEGAAGLTKARDAIGPKALRSRCGGHPRQKLQQKVPPPAWPELKAWGMERRDAPTGPAAQRRRQLLVNRYQRAFPAAWRCLLDAAEARLNPLSVPQRPQHYGRTSHLAERAFAEERRRTKVIPHLWDEGSVVKLVFAVLSRVRERWGTQCFREFEQYQMRGLRRQRQLDLPDGRRPAPAAAPARRSAASAA